MARAPTKTRDAGAASARDVRDAGAASARDALDAGAASARDVLDAGAASARDVLDAAIATARRGDRAEALAAALAAWRVAPSAELADAIERLGARAAETVAPPAGAKVADRNAAWDAAARGGDPVVRHHLIAQLAETKGSAETLARLELLAPHADPRVTTAVLAIAAVPIYNASSSRAAAFWKFVFAHLADAVDPRIAAHVAEIPARWAANASLTPNERAALAKRLAQLAPRPTPPVPAAAAAATRALLAACAGPADDGRERALLAAIYAAPADDAPRAVYADWLLDRGDPRGEFINLQLAGADTPRTRELLALHGRRWLGSLEPHVLATSVRFARGFLAAAALVDGRDHRAPGDALRPPADPAWATLVECTRHVPASDAHPMPALRTAHLLDEDEIVHLASLRAPPPLEVLSITSAYEDWSPDDGWFHETVAAAEALATAALPHLRRLELVGTSAWLSDDDDDDPEAATIAPADMIWPWRRPPIAELAVTAPVVHLGAWLAAAAPVAHLARVELYSAHDRRRAWCLALTRDERGALSRLAVAEPPPAHQGRREIATLVRAIAALPPSALTHATFARHPRAPNDTSPQAIVAALARQTRLVTPVEVIRRR